MWEDLWELAWVWYLGYDLVQVIVLEEW